MKTHKTNFRQSSLVLSASLFLLIATCFVAKPIFAADDADQKSHLEGTWTFVEGTTNGTSMGEVLKKRGIAKMQFEFVGNVLTMHTFHLVKQTWQFSLDAEKQPRELRLTTIETGGRAPQGLTTTGIYELDGDQLRLCLPADDTVGVPKDFKAPAGSRLSSLVLKRQTGEDETPAKQ